MATWVDCTSAHFGGFACDMGPYIGPWPLLPPGQMAGVDPADGGEVDFYVALPNPADTTDVTLVGDGSYDTPIWDAYRYTTTVPPTADTLFDYIADSTGPSAPFPIPATVPAGAHLYVAYYSFGTPGPPADPPEFYVPATYAAGGSSALETAMGHWSTDQAAWTDTKHVTQGSVVSGTHTASNSYSGNHDITGPVAAQIAAILASTPSPGVTSVNVAAQKVQTGGVTTMATTGNVRIVPYDGTTALADDFPAALGGLVYGVDYFNTPDIDADGASGPTYRYDTAPSWAWAAGAADGYSYEDFTDNSSGESPIGFLTRVQWVTGTITGTPWTVSGNVIADLAPFASTPPGSPNYALDYSTVTDLAFTVHSAQKFLYDGTIPGLTDFSFPGVGTKGFTDWAYFEPSTPDLVVDRSAWQYWIPGAIIPTGAKWHTIGGHWATVGGATLQILTPLAGGSVWVDVVDGPA